VSQTLPQTTKPYKKAAIEYQTHGGWWEGIKISRALVESN